MQQRSEEVETGSVKSSPKLDCEGRFVAVSKMGKRNKFPGMGRKERYRRDGSSSDAMSVKGRVQLDHGKL